MSKGEPIKLSTTFLVLFTQSFITTINWLSWLLHGMGKVWRSKFEFEKLSVFGKRDFDLWGKLLPIPSCIHVVVFPTFLELWELDIHIFAVFFIFLMVGKCFCQCSMDGITHGHFCVVSTSPRLGNFVFSELYSQW